MATRILVRQVLPLPIRALLPWLNGKVVADIEFADKGWTKLEEDETLRQLYGKLQGMKGVCYLYPHVPMLRLPCNRFNLTVGVSPWVARDVVRVAQRTIDYARPRVI